MPQSSSTSAPLRPRVTLRQRRTRRRLLDAARQLLASGGTDALTIAAVTEAADIGFGTFYGYFASKEGLLSAVLADTGDRIIAELDALTAGLDDPAEVIAVALRHVLRIGNADPQWAQFVVRMHFADGGLMVGSLQQRLERDVRRGVKAKRFSPEGVGTVIYLIRGGMLLAMRDRMDRRLPRNADREMAQHVLRLLGLAAGEAAEIAARPLPELPVQAA